MMARNLAGLAAAAVVGVGIGYFYRSCPVTECPVTVCPALPTVVPEVVSTTIAAVPTSLPVPTISAERVEIGTTVPDETNHRVQWRVSAIQKFVPLTTDEQERLTAKFRAEQTGASDTETLEEILGAERATTYREQVQSAFKRAEDEALEKDVLYISRKLGLSAEQENALRGVYRGVEVELESVGPTEQSTSAQRVQAMVNENRQRFELRSNKVKEFLNPEQYQAYLAEESESPAADMEVFHSSE